VRVFAPEAVEAGKVAQVLAAANAAPSAGNLQGYEIFRVTHEKERTALARAALDQFFVAQAPVVLVFCANQARSAAKYRERGARLYAIQDATIACAFAMLAATALGLGTVWVGSLRRRRGAARAGSSRSVAGSHPAHRVSGGRTGTDASAFTRRSGARSSASRRAGRRDGSSRMSGMPR